MRAGLSKIQAEMTELKDLLGKMKDSLEGCVSRILLI